MVLRRTMKMWGRTAGLVRCMRAAEQSSTKAPPLPASVLSATFL